MERRRTGRIYSLVRQVQIERGRDNEKRVQQALDLLIQEGQIDSYESSPDLDRHGIDYRVSRRNGAKNTKSRLKAPSVVFSMKLTITPKGIATATSFLLSQAAKSQPMLSPRVL